MVLIAKRCTLLRKDNASLAWTASILPFVNVQKFLSLPNHSIRVCVTEIKINRGARYGLELPAEHIHIHMYFMTMRKLFNEQREY